MEDLVHQGDLFAFYGALLNPRQRRVLEMAVISDYSLAEIAEAEGTSRQAVHDSIHRSLKTLEAYESALGLIRRFESVRTAVSRIEAGLLAIASEHPDTGSACSALCSAADSILEELSDGL